MTHRHPGLDEDVILGEVVDVMDDESLDVEIHSEDTRNVHEYGLVEVICLDGCLPEPTAEEGGRHSRRWLEREALGQVVEFRVHGRDGRGRVVATLVRDDDDGDEAA